MLAWLVLGLTLPERAYRCPFGPHESRRNIVQLRMGLPSIAACKHLSPKSFLSPSQESSRFCTGIRARSNCDWANRFNCSGLDPLPDRSHANGSIPIDEPVTDTSAFLSCARVSSGVGALISSRVHSGPQPQNRHSLFPDSGREDKMGALNPRWDFRIRSNRPCQHSSPPQIPLAGWSE